MRSRKTALLAVVGVAALLAGACSSSSKTSTATAGATPAHDGRLDGFERIERIELRL